jgi:hypothetical protein
LNSKLRKNSSRLVHGPRLRAQLVLLEQADQALTADPLVLNRHGKTRIVKPAAFRKVFL